MNIEQGTRNRISNTEQGISNHEVRVVLNASFTSRFDIPCSLFDIRMFDILFAHSGMKAQCLNK